MISEATSSFGFDGARAAETPWMLARHLQFCVLRISGVIGEAVLANSQSVFLEFRQRRTHKRFVSLGFGVIMRNWCTRALWNLVVKRNKESTSLFSWLVSSVSPFPFY